MNKPGMTNSSGTGMKSNTTGTRTKKAGMAKDNMKQGGASKDGMGQMNKGGTSK